MSIIAGKFRKKPVTIEALYLGDTNAGRVVEWINTNGGAAIMRGGPRGGSKGATVGIETLEGRIWYEPGWVIIRGVEGEFYGCRRDIFEKTYEPVDEDGAS